MTVRDAVRAAVRRDKKAVGGTIRYVVLDAVGRGAVESLTAEGLEEAIDLALEAG